MQTDRQDVYTRITNAIVADLEQGVRPWVQPWESSHAAGEVSRPLRFNGVPYRGINIVLLWVAAMRQRFSCPLWMTYKQAVELGGQVRRGEKGSLVVYADTDHASADRRKRRGANSARCPSSRATPSSTASRSMACHRAYYAQAERHDSPSRANRACRAILREHRSRHPARRRPRLLLTLRRLHPDATLRELPRGRIVLRNPCAMRQPIRRGILRDWPVISVVNVGATKATPWKNSLPS